MNYAFAELITNPQTIFSSSAHYIYPKGKYLWRISVMLRFQFLIEMKNACYTLFFGTDNLSVVKNLSMVSAAIDYILVLAGKFNVPLFITEIQESHSRMLTYICFFPNSFFKLFYRFILPVLYLVFVFACNTVLLFLNFLLCVSLNCANCICVFKQSKNTQKSGSYKCCITIELI